MVAASKVLSGEWEKNGMEVSSWKMSGIVAKRNQWSLTPHELSGLNRNARSGKINRWVLIIVICTLFSTNSSFAISLGDYKWFPSFVRKAVGHLIQLALFNEPRPGPGRNVRSVSIIKCPEASDENVCLDVKIDLVNVDTAKALRTLSLIEAAISDPCRYLVRPAEGIYQAEWDEYMFGFSKINPKDILGVSHIKAQAVRDFEKTQFLFKCMQTEQSIPLQRYRLNTIRITIDDLSNDMQHSKTVKVGGNHE